MKANIKGNGWETERISVGSSVQFGTRIFDTSRGDRLRAASTMDDQPNEGPATPELEPEELPETTFAITGDYLKPRFVTGRTSMGYR